MPKAVFIDSLLLYIHLVMSHIYLYLSVFNSHTHTHTHKHSRLYKKDSLSVQGSITVRDLWVTFAPEHTIHILKHATSSAYGPMPCFTWRDLNQRPVAKVAKEQTGNPVVIKDWAFYQTLIQCVSCVSLEYVLPLLIKHEDQRKCTCLFLFRIF